MFNINKAQTDDQRVGERNKKGYVCTYSDIRDKNICTECRLVNKIYAVLVYFFKVHLLVSLRGHVSFQKHPDHIEWSSWDYRGTIPTRSNPAGSGD